MKHKATHKFSEIPKANIQRSSFDRSHGWKGTINGGVLVPFFVDEALPGDTFNAKASVFGRLATPIKPIMDNLYCDTHFFAVPIRLLWENWEKFNGAQDNPGDSTEYIIPTAVSGAAGHTPGSLPDYMGIPPGVPDLEYNSLPFRAYDLIWNEWFRDENLQDSNEFSTDDNTPPPRTLMRRGKRHDYFTSCLPFAQKGDPVSLPLGVSAPIVGIGAPTFSHEDGTLGVLEQTSGAGNNAQWEFDVSTGGGDDTASWLNPNLQADLTDATAATINDIREAFQIQRLLERDARGGTRYTEIVRSHFNVISPDARLQRPEFLGGGTSPVNINPVQQTTPTVDDTPQGNLAGYGTVQFSGHGFTKSFTEHCYIIGLISFRADLTYQQGVNRLFQRKTRYDFYWPALSHLGEQAVTNSEIWATGDPAIDNATFGFQERYAEYRYKPSLITGLFRSDVDESLDYWHLSQDFTTLPVLGNAFIADTPPIDRVIAVPTEPDFLVDAWFRLKCARPMPLYGVPGFVDHF